MQTAEQARQSSLESLTGLTFIDILVSGATMQGLRTINIDGNTVSSDMITALRNNGYEVGIQYFFGDEENRAFPRCIIRW